MRSVSSAPMPASGSSSSSTWGSVARHMATSSWRLAPWLGLPAVRWAWWASPARSSAWWARSMLAAQCWDGSQMNQGLGRTWACAVRRQFSSTVNSGKMVVRW